MVDFISMGLLDMWGSRTDNYKMKNSCPHWDLNQGSFASEANGSVLAKGCAISWDFLQIFLHQRFWTTINRFSLPSEYRQPMKSSICHTFIGFQRCTKIPINTDSLRVPRSVRPSLYPFYSPNCLHILSKVFRSTAKQPTPEVGSIRCGSSRIQKNY